MSGEITLPDGKQLHVLERRIHAAALGVRFWDPSLDSPVGDGLAVTVRPADNSGPARQGVRGPSGLYSFHAIPGLHEAEAVSDWETVHGLTPKPYLLEVEDRAGRFLPMAVALDLPQGAQGLLVDPSEPGDPLGTGGVIPLFSAPSRPLTPGLAVIRGVLAEKATGNPAAFAVLEITAGDGTWHGVADVSGNIALLFAYPRLTQAVGGSGGLVDAEWEVSLRVLYKPPANPASGKKEMPELRELFLQSQGKLWPPGAIAAVDSWNPTLTYGRALVLSTLDPEGKHGPFMIDPGP